MNKKIGANIGTLFALGLLLVLIKALYLFFDFYNLLDVVVFFIAGYIISANMPALRPIFALILALPAFVLCAVFVIKLGYSSIAQGVGTSFAISLIAIPLATYAGFFIRLKRSKQTGRG